MSLGGMRLSRRNGMANVLLRLFGVVLACVAASAAFGQSWPDRPIKFVVAAPAGSSIDVLARLIGEKLKDKLGQPVIVENRPAAGGTAATDFVAKSAPDGYTMLMSFNGPLAFAPHLYSKLPYDPQKDLVPVDHHLEPAERAGRDGLAAGAARCTSWSRTRRPIRASSTTHRSATAARRT